jgi:hypothetical protein
MTELQMAGICSPAIITLEPMMNSHWKAELIRLLETLERQGYLGLLAAKYLPKQLMTPDAGGQCVLFVNIASPAGWAVIGFSSGSENQKHIFSLSESGRWFYQGQCADMDLLQTPRLH